MVKPVEKRATLVTVDAYPCHALMCGNHGSEGYGPQGTLPGKLWIFVCPDHRAEGEEHYRKCNGG